MPTSQHKNLDVQTLVIQLEHLLEAEELQTLLRQNTNDSKGVFSISKQDPLLPQLQRLTTAFDTVLNSETHTIDSSDSSLLQKARDLVFQLADQLGDQNLADPKHFETIRRISDSIHDPASQKPNRPKS